MENWNADKNVLSKSGDKVDCVIIIEGNRKKCKLSMEETVMN